MIVEIGPRPYIAGAFPAETQFFATDFDSDEPEGIQRLRGLGALWRALGRADLELVVVQPGFAAPWSARHLSRAIVSKRLLTGRSPLFRALGPELLRLRRRARIAVLDMEDLPVVNRSNLSLLDRCDLWFKRELPADYWRVFMKTAHAQLPTPRFRLKSQQMSWIEKLRPMALGLPLASVGLLPRTSAEKRVDVFFSGRADGSSTVRSRGMAELRALQAQGVSVDIPDATLPRDSFYDRCAAAWLVWSPEGLGWDCFRHYEAAACGSVALINAPPLDRYAPLIHAEHALFYAPEPGGLTAAVHAALADKPALARIAAAGQAHVMQHHTPDALARHIVAEARALR